MIIPTKTPIVLLLIFVLAAPSRSAFALAPAEAKPAPGFAEIQVAATIEDAELVEGWMAGAVRDGLARAGVREADVEGRKLVVDVSGLSFAFKLRVGVQRDGAWVEPPRDQECACAEQKLIDSVREAVVEVAPLLREPESKAPAPRVRAEPTGRTEHPQDEPSTRLNGFEKGAIAAGVVGLGVTGVGVWLAVRGKRGKPDADDFEFEVGRDTRDAGIALTVVGAASVVASIALGAYGANKRRRSTTALPIGGRGFVGFGFAGRF